MADTISRRTIEGGVDQIITFPNDHPFVQARNPEGKSLGCYLCGGERAIHTSGPKESDEIVMTDELFRQTLVRHMCDDLPTLDEITKAERKDREHILDCVAVQKGFGDWLDAYHEILKPRPKAAVQTRCGCRDCLGTAPHASDCAVHNAPASPAGPCNCGVGNCKFCGVSPCRCELHVCHECEGTGFSR